MNEVRLHWEPTPTLHALASVALAGVVTAGLLRNGTVLILVLPELLWLAAYARPTLPASVALQLACERLRIEEGQPVRASLLVQPPPWLTVDAVCDGRAPDPRGAHRTARGWEFQWSVRPPLWGHRPACHGQLSLCTHGGLWVSRVELTWPVATILPTTTPVRSTIAAARLRGAPGAHAARSAAQSGQPSGTAPYAAGTPVRRVNWAQTLRHRSLHVTTFEAERAQDVILLVDALTEVGPHGRTTVDRAVRAAASLARAHIRDGDRVGLVVVTPALSWVLPGSGEHHLARLLELLAHLRDRSSLLPPELDRVPPSAVPPGSQVLALTPLLHKQSVALVSELRRAGHAVVVIDVLTTEPQVDPRQHLSLTARRLWRLDRAATRTALSDWGALVLAWPDDQDLESVLASLPAGVRDGRWMGRAS